MTPSVLFVKTVICDSYYWTLTFVKTCRHVAGRRAQQNPEYHSTCHESPSVGWRQETQTGQDYSGQTVSGQCTYLDTSYKYKDSLKCYSCLLSVISDYTDESWIQGVFKSFLSG